MGKRTENEVFDAALLNVVNNADRLVVCSQEPLTYAEVDTYALAEATMTPGDGNDYTIADGDAGGRKYSTAAKNSVPVDANGDATQLVLADSNNSLIKEVTTCTTQTLSDTGTINIPSFDSEFADPT